MCRLELYYKICLKNKFIKACQTGDLKIIKRCLEEGVNVDSEVGDGETVLHSVVYYSYYEIAKFLLEKGANINAESDQEYTPITYAIIKQNHKMIKLLLDHGASVSSSDKVALKKYLFKTGDLRLLKRNM